MEPNINYTNLHNAFAYNYVFSPFMLGLTLGLY